MAVEDDMIVSSLVVGLFGYSMFQNLICCVLGVLDIMKTCNVLTMVFLLIANLLCYYCYIIPSWQSVILQ